MTEIKKLMETIVSDLTSSGKSNMASKVFKDEPILMTASQMKNFTPPKYREMRKIAKQHSIYQGWGEELFYQQAKFMEDFEDDYEFNGDFSRYFPTYQYMNDHQLRGYFSWRTKVRKGTIVETSLSFVFVYLYELLNQIGASSPEEGFHIIKAFWLRYREIDDQLDRYVRVWLKDYVVYYDLDPSYLDGMLDTQFDQVMLTLMEYQEHDADQVFAALDSVSSYNLRKSKFYKQYPDDVKEVLYHVFAALSAFYEKNRKNSFCENIFGKVTVEPYKLFHAAVFHHQVKRSAYQYKINDIHVYRYNNGGWNRESMQGSQGKNQMIGTLLKCIDSRMRQAYQFRAALKEPVSTKHFVETITQEIEAYQLRKRKQAQPKVDIDISKLQDIRMVALETQNKLIVDEPEVLGESQAAPEAKQPKNDTNLSDTEYRVLGCLLYDRPYDALVKAKGLMLSVLLDSINDTLFDLFSDTVIVFDGEKPELIEDYIDELKGIIKE